MSYEGVGKKLITTYKDHDEARLDSVLAKLLCACVRADGDELAGVRGTDWAQWADCLVAIPANPVNLRRRGWDHLQRIALLCADELALPLLDALVSRRAADQRGLSANQRAANRADSFVLRDDAPPLPARVLLIDDVFTTGATLNAAASCLLASGAKEVRAATLARVW